MLPKYLSKTGLFASCSHQSVIESPCRSRSMLPCFAVATNPSCLGPIRWLVWVKVAATLRRGADNRLYGPHVFTDGEAEAAAPSANPLHSLLTLSHPSPVRPGEGGS